MAQQGWVKVQADAAARHRLYGVSGWLAFFLLIQTLGVIFTLIGLIEELRVSTLFPLRDRWEVPAFLVGTGVSVLLSAVAVGLGFARSARFPAVITQALSLEIVVGLLQTRILGILSRDFGWPDEIYNEQIVLTVLIIVICALLIWYYAASARVRVTYRHEVRPGDPYAAAVLSGEPHRAPPAAPSPERPAGAWPPSQATQPSVPSPAQGGAPRSRQDRLLELKALYEQGLIDEATYKQRQAAIVQDL